MSPLTAIVQAGLHRELLSGPLGSAACFNGRGTRPSQLYFTSVRGLQTLEDCLLHRAQEQLRPFLPELAIACLCLSGFVDVFFTVLWSTD
jgi:hypothetical protein